MQHTNGNGAVSNKPLRIQPHGGKLCDLLLTGDARNQAMESSLDAVSHQLDPRQLCDLELLMNGGFSPLTGFLDKADYESVLESMRLADGTLWPMPITLDLPEELATSLSKGDPLALRDETGLLLAVLTVDEIWKPEKEREAEKVFGTKSLAHPAVKYLFEEAGSYYVSGNLACIQLPPHYDFPGLRHTPRQLRQALEQKGSTNVVAFQTRNPMHRAHKEITDRAADELGGVLLIHPVVGMTKPGDVDYFTRVRCYQKLIAHYPGGRAMLSLLPLAMRMAGPREALWHALIRKNYGCSHFIVGRDHAGPGNDENGQPFYGPYDAQELVSEYEEEMEIRMVPFQMMVYSPGEDRYKAVDEVAPGEKTLNLSGTEQRRLLEQGAPIPEWFSYPDVVEELRKTYPPRSEQGFTVFFTGLSGSGKSTIANALIIRLLERGDRAVTLLDGDVVRTNLSRGLGFSKEDRSLNVRRIGYVASEVTRHGGIAVCAPIAPFEEDRQANRQMISSGGGYVEVFVNTPIEECEKRDVKGLYAKARAGIIKGFTGIDDPYEEPLSAEVSCDTTHEPLEESVNRILAWLQQEGYMQPSEAIQEVEPVREERKMEIALAS